MTVPTQWIRADWSAPTGVQTMVTTRHGGFSHAPFDDGAGGTGMNLGDNTGDQSSAVQANRTKLEQSVGLPICWLEQVHGTQVATVASSHLAGQWLVPTADAAVTAADGVVLAIQTADCLPVLLAAPGVVGAAHAGWRGLAAGVLENTVNTMCSAGADMAQLCAWLGPGIGPASFEVGEDVYQAFCDHRPTSARHFQARPLISGKWLADLYGLARDRLQDHGVTQISGGGYCTLREPARFYSYRRQPRTGRMASLIWQQR